MNLTHHASKAVFAVGATHKNFDDIESLSKRLPVEVIHAKKMRFNNYLRFVPIPKPIEFTIKINNPYCISELVKELCLFLIIGIHVFEADMISDFIIAMENRRTYSLKQLSEIGRSSLFYLVDFDNQECETGIMEYWVYDSSLTNELALYV